MIQRIFLILQMSFFGNLVYSQSLGIKIYLKDFCNDTIYPTDNIFIRDSNDSSFIYENVPSEGLKTGVYRVSIMEIGEMSIELKDNEIYIDTFYLPIVKELIGATTAGGYYGFYNCDELCQGSIIDFYKKGTKRLEGVFKDGVPIGQLKTYYSNGNLLELREYTKNKRLKRIIQYDQLGKQTNIEEKGHKIKIVKPPVPY